MPRQIFVNLSYKDLKKANAFFKALGYEFNPTFSDDNATCVIVSDDIFVMAHAQPHFKRFTPKPIFDASQGTETIICLSLDTREEVDGIVQKAVAAGGSKYNEAQDHGFMYQHGFQDPDGHIWEYVAMTGAPPWA